ncbi:hypothetical protein FJY70_04250, partial [candidate division WOR-3 bacterium]|nr:hypothetical protein [candidate division WOR-3 bacterium]
MNASRAWRVDLKLVVISLLLAGIGLLAIYSSGGPRHFYRQLVFLPAALGAGAAVLFLPRRILYGLAEPLYALVLLLLVAVLFVGAGPGSH